MLRGNRRFKWTAIDPFLSLINLSKSGKPLYSGLDIVVLRMRGNMQGNEIFAKNFALFSRVFRNWLDAEEFKIFAEVAIATRIENQKRRQYQC